MLELGAVEGEIFHRGTVQALSEESRITPHLASLVRKELIRPERSVFPGDDAFRFRHLLIRDATYEALPKSTRAESPRALRRMGAVSTGGIWSSTTRSSATTWSRRPAASENWANADPELARRAGDRLAAAGRRALARGDSRAARGLLARSLALTRDLRLDIELELDLCESEYLRSPETAAAIAEAAASNAGSFGRSSRRGDRASRCGRLPLARHGRVEGQGGRGARAARCPVARGHGKRRRPRSRVGGARRDRESARSSRGSPAVGREGAAPLAPRRTSADGAASPGIRARLRPLPC